ncbi:MAG: hypothetical protein AAF889_09940, partial [Cyanobacteria bacterium P01_D01_bin.73]
GELLWGNYGQMTRLGRLKPVPQLSGFAAQRHPWMLTPSKPSASSATAYRRPLTSSCGWLLGEVASLLDLPQSGDRHRRLMLEDLAREVLTDDVIEAIAHGSWGQEQRGSRERYLPAINFAGSFSGNFSTVDAAYPFPVLAINTPANHNHRGCEFPLCSASVELPSPIPFSQLDPSPMWSALMMDLHHKRPHTTIAAKLHCGLAVGLAQWVATARQPSPMSQSRTIALTGSVFQNRLLLQLLVPQLQKQGLDVLLHREVPMGDGGVSLGQAAIAAAQSLEQTRN